MAIVPTASINVSLQITANNFKYQNNPTAFRPNITFANGPNGPTPGALTISVNGTDITFPQLTAMGGLIVFTNIDALNFITIGVRDKTSNEFYPLFEVPAGEGYPMRLSRKLGKEELGTGTFSGSNSVMHAKADTANAILVIEAFDP